MINNTAHSKNLCSTKLFNFNLTVLQARYLRDLFQADMHSQVHCLMRHGQHSSTDDMMGSSGVCGCSVSGTLCLAIFRLVLDWAILRTVLDAWESMLAAWMAVES